MVTARSSGSKADNFRTSYNVYLEEFGTTVTLNRNTETLDNQGRVTGITTVSSTIKADIQWVSKQDIMHLNLGQAKVGDGMLYTKYSANIELEDEVLFNSVKWRILEQVEGELVQGNVIYKGFVIRKND